MEPKLENIVQALQEKFGVTFEEFRGEAHVLVQPGQIIAALTLLRDEYGFELLSAHDRGGLLAAGLAALPRRLPAHFAWPNTAVAAAARAAGRRTIPGIPTADAASTRRPTGASASSWICSGSTSTVIPTRAAS